MSLRLVPTAHPEGSLVKSIADTATINGIHDTFRHGLRSLQSEVAPSHSLENRLAKWDETQDATRLTMYRQIYGIHSPVKLLMERRLVSRVTSGRLPVLPSSNISLDILMGRDETIDFEDFLTDAGSTDILDVHASMEQKLGMKL